MIEQLRKNYIWCPLLFGVLIIGFLLGWYFGRQKIEADILSGGVSSLRQSTDYKLISPLLLCGALDNKDFTEYKALEKKINDFIASTVNGKSTLVGVYFRDLVNGHWVGINENQKFSPASLLKVPIMIAYFKFAQKNAGSLSKAISYDGSFNVNDMEYFHSDYLIKPGVYKIEDLIKAMVINSDNNATKLLSDNIDHDSLAEVYTDLGLFLPPDDKPDGDFISAKSYSYFFRVLYNATYLFKRYSERALEILATPNFPQGISGSVPTEVVVAQKFGERSLFTNTGVLDHRELHNCGIVYNPKHPYVLCVMTKGRDFPSLAQTIQGINRIVYDDVSQLGQ